MTVDIILLLVFIVFVLSGYRRGLILSLCSLLILVLSCLGASVAQEVLTPRVTERMMPQVTELIEEKLEDTLEESTEHALTESGDSVVGAQVDSIAQLFGIDLDAVLGEAAEQVAEPLIARAAQAMAQAFVEAFAGTLIFMAAFLIIYLLMKSLELGINTVDRLPVIHTLNHLGGGVIGGVSGAFTLVMVMALLRGTGVFPEDSFSGPVSGLLEQIVGSVFGRM